MKTTKQILVLLTLMIVTIVSCNNDDNTTIDTTEAKITEISIGSLGSTIADIDEQNKTISVVVPEDVDLNDLSPVITASTNATISPSSFEGVDFSKPITLTVTSAGGTVQTYTLIITYESTTEPAYVVTITNVSSTTVAPENDIIITGKNFRLANNAVFLKSEAESAPLQIISENREEIKAKLPNYIKDGEYSLVVRCGSDIKTATYDTKILVVDPNAPMLTSLDKTTIVKGTDGIKLTGLNLGSSATVYVKRTSIVIDKPNLTEVTTSQNGGTTIALPAEKLNSLELGIYEVWVKVGIKETQRLQFTLTGGGTPSILKVWITEFCINTYTILDVADFNKDNFTVRLDAGSGNYYNLPILDVYDNTVTVGPDDIPGGIYQAIEVVSDGKIGRLDVAITANDCGSPQNIRMPETQGYRGGDLIRIQADNLWSIATASIDFVTLELGGITIAGHVRPEAGIILFRIPENAAVGITDIKVYRSRELIGNLTTERLYFTVPSFEIL